MVLENLPQNQGISLGRSSNYVQNLVIECVVFQQNKEETIKTLGLLQPLAIPSKHWGEV
jgi:hypothetical protein